MEKHAIVDDVLIRFGELKDPRVANQEPELPRCEISAFSLLVRATMDCVQAFQAVVAERIGDLIRYGELCSPANILVRVATPVDRQRRVEPP